MTSSVVCPAESDYLCADASLPCAGYTVILYDRLESIGDSLDDVTSVTALRHIMDWAGTHPLVSQVADASRYVHTHTHTHTHTRTHRVVAARTDKRTRAMGPHEHMNADAVHEEL